MCKKVEIKLPLKRHEQQAMNESGFMYRATQLIYCFGEHLHPTSGGASDNTISSS